MEPTKMDLYAVQGYNLLTMRDRIIKITSDIQIETVTHERRMAELKAELDDLHKKVLEEGFVLANSYQSTVRLKVHPMYWVAGDKVKRISGKNPNVYTRGKEYVVLAIRNDDGRTVLLITDNLSVNDTSYCVFGISEAEEKFELVK